MSNIQFGELLLEAFFHKCLLSLFLVKLLSSHVSRSEEPKSDEQKKKNQALFLSETSLFFWKNKKDTFWSKKKSLSACFKKLYFLCVCLFLICFGIDLRNGKRKFCKISFLASVCFVAFTQKCFVPGLYLQTKQTGHYFCVFFHVRATTYPSLVTWWKFHQFC